MAVILENIPLLEGYTPQELQALSNKLAGTLPQLASLIPKMIVDYFTGGKQDDQMTRIIQTFEKPVPVQVHMQVDTRANAYTVPFVYMPFGQIFLKFPLVSLLVLGRMLITWGFKFKIQNKKVICINAPRNMQFISYYSLGMRRVLDDDTELLTGILLHELGHCLTISSFLRMPRLATILGAAVATRYCTKEYDITIGGLITLTVTVSYLIQALASRFIFETAADDIAKDLGYGPQLAEALKKLQFNMPSSHIWYGILRANEILFINFWQALNLILPIFTHPSMLARRAYLTDDPHLHPLVKFFTFFDRTAAKLVNKLIHWQTS